MRTETEAQTILHSIETLMRRQSDDLWGAEEIASYLKLSKSSVQCRILILPNFPPPVQLPSGEKRGTKRWVAKEVIAWVLRHR